MSILNLLNFNFIEVFQYHCKMQCFVLKESKMSSDSDILVKDDSFTVLSHRCGINNKEVSRFLKSV